MIDQTQKIDVLWVMLQQERKTYRIVRQKFACTDRSRLETGPNYLINRTICNGLLQDGGRNEWRYNMVDWCYRIIDFCDFNRETAAIAMNFVDRFVTSDKGKSYLMNNSMYQLLVVTALYTAIKVHERRSIDLQSLSNVSRGVYSVEQIEVVEREMVDALQWRLNPPTAMSFAQGLFDIIPRGYIMSAQDKENILKLSRVQTEGAVYVDDLIDIKMSTIGYCSLINALITVIDDLVVLKHLKHVLAQELQFRIIDKHDVAHVQPKLYLLLTTSDQNDHDGR